jgi:Fic family protein
MSTHKSSFPMPVSAMDPLLPSHELGTLMDLSVQVFQESGRLSGLVHEPLVRDKISDLVRSMNCYYSNLIEGHKTLPRDIEQAMQQHFSSDTVKKDNQLLGLAHIDVERRMGEWIKEPGTDVYRPEFICRLHREFYQRLPASLQEARTKGGKMFAIAPGQFRDFMVDVGGHTPPPPEALDRFMARFHAFYGGPEIAANQRVIAIAAAHHRLAWIHPFGDGNGRVARLHSQALMNVHELDSGGLWTISRGLARQRSRYYAQLAGADKPRQGDLDGRGNLSDKGLASFCRFFLETMLDQTRFMSGLLELPTLRTRIERYFQFEDVAVGRYRQEVMKVVRVLADEGEIPRYRVREITGKGATVSAEIIKLALAEGYIETPSDKGVLRIAFPTKVLPGYFPQLFMDLPVEGEP